MIRRWFPLLLAALCATSEAADEPGSADCSLLTAAAYGTVPLLFYEDRADSLLQLLDDWEAVCGPTEAIQRTRILGAIWDGAFAEDLYGTEIMEDLVQRGAEFRDGSMATPVRAAYDSFTVELADQLLPHQPAGTPEEFFCFFYSGRTDEAWALIDDGELGYTDLAYYRARRLSLLKTSSARLQVGLIFGNWYPSGELEFVGEKPLVGAEVSWWREMWFTRLVGEWRPGRSDTPYLTESEGNVYFSDRWDAVLLGGEMGRRILGDRGWRLDVFAGLGVDLIKPLGGSNELLTALQASVGAGMRYDIEEDGPWYMGFDVRAEYVGDRNEELVNLGGGAWSVRFMVGRILTTSDQETRELLGR